jgi:hypothetical protein
MSCWRRLCLSALPGKGRFSWTTRPFPRFRAIRLPSLPPRSGSAGIKARGSTTGRGASFSAGSKNLLNTSSGCKSKAGAWIWKIYFIFYESYLIYYNTNK